MSRKRTRRDFLKTTTWAGVGFWVTGNTVHASSSSPNEKLNIAGIGVGGKGWTDVNSCASENIVALCDVDAQRLGKMAERYPRAATYRDFRRLLERKDIDAVTISTPDHMHAPAAVMAMTLGKHVYCQKPLTHSIDEARRLRRIAAHYKVATQMGNQGHSESGSRRMVELVRAGAIGEVREVHVWTDRPIWPQEIDRPTSPQAVPTHVDWDLWLGVAPERPYHEAYHPFKWRGWWDFGTGALGDMACHNMDMAFWALELGAPSSVEARISHSHPETAPKWSVIRYAFPARGKLPPVELIWYDGGKKPPAKLFHGEKQASNGSILVGSRGNLYVPHYWGEGKLLPVETFEDYRGPEPTLPRSPGHYKEWIAAAKGGPAALSSFEYATELTEMVLLGNLAVRAGHRIDWDAASMKVTNCSTANQYVRREYRKGWEV